MLPLFTFLPNSYYTIKVMLAQMWQSFLAYNKKIIFTMRGALLYIGKEVEKKGEEKVGATQPTLTKSNYRN